MPDPEDLTEDPREDPIEVPASDPAEDVQDLRTVADVGEDALVAAVVARLRATGGGDRSSGPARVLVGPGDDAAVLELDGPLVTSTDTLVEGVDFRTDWSTARQVGRKAAVQVLADVEAMGAVPVGLLVSLVVPGSAGVDWCLGLADGLADEARRAGVDVLGGDVADGGALVVTGTSVGVLVGDSPAVGRGGAVPGDVVALGGGGGTEGPSGVAGSSGPATSVGASAAGLALLVAGHGGEPALGAGDQDATGRAVARALAAHRAPSPDHAAGPRARAAGAHALIDVSDGLVRDATRVARASDVVLDLTGSALRPGGDLLAVAALLGLGPDAAQEWVLTSGEEHAMLACFPEGTVLPDGFVAVGTVREAGHQGPGVSVDGVRREDAGGWTHYGRRP